MCVRERERERNKPLLESKTSGTGQLTFPVTLLVETTVTHCRKEEEGRKEGGVEERERERERECDNDSKVHIMCNICSPLHFLILCSSKGKIMSFEF